jgi:ethanolamine ammonia-lyase large subunit
VNCHTRRAPAFHVCDDLRGLRAEATPARFCDRLAGIAADDVTLNDWSTSPHDTLHLRDLLGLGPALFSRNH